MRPSTLIDLALSLVLTPLVAGSAFAIGDDPEQEPCAPGIVAFGKPPSEATRPLGAILETRPPVGIGQKPAFEGQTRAPAVQTKARIQTEVIASGLTYPWAIAFLPDGQALVTEQVGRMRIVTSKGQVGDPIAGLPAVSYGCDGGLLDVKTDPNFASNRTIYWTYTEPRVGGNGLTVARGRLSDDGTRVDDVRVIVRTLPTIEGRLHYGSRLQIGRDGTLFVSVGERKVLPSAIRDQAQDLNSHLGKILRINPDGSIPQDNPFVGRERAKAEIWSYGHRHVQGMTIHPDTGVLWATEHGPQGGDEVNVIEPDKNYGWPIIAYGKEYNGEPVNGGLTAYAGMEQPIYYWDPAIAPSGATFYSGKLVPEWKGNLFVASLAGQHISRLVLNGERVVGEERLLLEQRQRIRDVQEGPDGGLWVVTFDSDGKILRVTPMTRAR
jgi:glucose/arabinose dehydrogenase